MEFCRREEEVKRDDEDLRKCFNPGEWERFSVDGRDGVQALNTNSEKKR